MKYKIYALILLAVVHVVMTFGFVAPGSLSCDEAIYRWMAKTFSETYSLTVWNGYEEFPSPELQHRYFRPYYGQLQPQYPPFFAVLVLPFYRIFGFFGLFIANAAAFLLVIALCFLVAKKLFDDTNLALNACFLLIFGTFVWEYSQAAWPHVTGLVFCLAAFYCSISAYDANTKRSALLYALACGCIWATGLSVRLDNMLILPALILPFLFAKELKLREAGAVILGAVPPLLVLATANYMRFGKFNPFSYGDEPLVQSLSPWIQGTACAVVLVVWLVTRPQFSRLSVKSRIVTWVFVGLGALSALALIPGFTDLIARMLHDAYTSTVDVRTLSPDSPVAPRSAGGGVLYGGAHKKALLQSIPYLALLLIPCLCLIERRRDFRPLAVLFLPILTVVCFYSYTFPYHDMGGMCLNTRYFIPFLPFIAILCAYGIKELQSRWGGPPPRLPILVMMLLFTAAIFFLFTKKLYTGINALEFPLLSVPLYLAVIFLMFLIGGLCLKPPLARPVRDCTWVVLGACITWSAMTALCYDYPAHRHVRVVQAEYGQKLLDNISTDSIVFADNKTFTVAMSVIEKPKARVAFPPGDKFGDFKRLLDFQLKMERRAFAFFYNPLWSELQTGLLASYRIMPLIKFQSFTLAEISKSPTTTP